MPDPLPVTYLYSRACPSHEEGLARLREAAARAGREVRVTVHEVRDDAEAERLGFTGSPTYLICGRDIAEPAAGMPFAADSCRAYRQPDGRIGPLPHPDDLLRALGGERVA